MKNFKAWTLVDGDGEFIVAILVAPSFQGRPKIPEQFIEMARNRVFNVIEGLHPHGEVPF